MKSFTFSNQDTGELKPYDAHLARVTYISITLFVKNFQVYIKCFEEI